MRIDKEKMLNLYYSKQVIEDVNTFGIIRRILRTKTRTVYPPNWKYV